MAVDEFFCRPTDSLLLPDKAFYPVKIPIAHWQLRHFISSPEPDVLYYASGPDVYRLNTRTQSRTHICILPFEARCTASGHGWLCIGGEEDGHFSAISLEYLTEPEANNELPMDFSSWAFEGSSWARITSTMRSPPTIVRMARVGEEIVNSISIHHMDPENGDRGGDEVIAVLTNNDKTVRLYSLSCGCEDCVLDLPFPMNHATLSPDGHMLVAVGDYHQAYFFGRSRTKAAEESPRWGPNTWNVVAVVQLHVPSPSLNTGYFTTAWSPSGHLCAVGSECGYITVFDPALLNADDNGEGAVVQTIPSSRPDTLAGPGAVRTMCFSPAPWDLLIWSEDQGRVCVADLRAGLLVRQVLHLNPSEAQVKKTKTADSVATATNVDHSAQLMAVIETDNARRNRSTPDGLQMPVTGSFAGDYIEWSAERRRMSRQAGVVESDNDPHGLTMHERQILEALRTTRQREEARERGITPRSISYTPSTFGSTEQRRTPQPPAADSSLHSNRPALPPIHGTSSLRDFLRERNYDPDRPPWQPRRQASVVLASGGGTGSGTGTGSTSATTPAAPAPPTSSSTRTYITNPNNIPPSYAQRSLETTNAANMSINEPWRIIEAAMARTSTNDPRVPHPLFNSSTTPTNPEPRTTHTQPPHPRAPAPFTEALSEMQRVHQLARARDRVRNMRDAQALAAGRTTATSAAAGGGAGYEVGSLRRQAFGLRNGPQWGVRTAGLAMSEDGRTLYVGCEEGIFEIGINVQLRKFLPAMQLR